MSRTLLACAPDDLRVVCLWLLSQQLSDPTVEPTTPVRSADFFTVLRQTLQLRMAALSANPSGLPSSAAENHANEKTNENAREHVRERSPRSMRDAEGTRSSPLPLAEQLGLSVSACETALNRFFSSHTWSIGRLDLSLKTLGILCDDAEAAKVFPDLETLAHQAVHLACAREGASPTLFWRVIFERENEAGEVVDQAWCHGGIGLSRANDILARAPSPLWSSSTARERREALSTRFERALLSAARGQAQVESRNRLFETMHAPAGPQHSPSPWAWETLVRVGPHCPAPQQEAADHWAQDLRDALVGALGETFGFAQAFLSPVEPLSTALADHVSPQQKQHVQTALMQLAHRHRTASTQHWNEPSERSVHISHEPAVVVAIASDRPAPRVPRASAGALERVSGPAGYAEDPQAGTTGLVKGERSPSLWPVQSPSRAPEANPHPLSMVSEPSVLDSMAASHVAEAGRSRPHLHRVK